MSALIPSIGVVVTAVVSLYVSGALSVLERRVRAHTALVKDMPEDIAKPLRELLDDEVQLLVARERRRLAPRSRRTRWGDRAALFGVGMGLLALLANVATSLLPQDTDPMEAPTWLLVATLVALASAGVAAMVLLVMVVRRARSGPYNRAHRGSSVRQ